jgi:hypothetical protein
MQAFDLDLSIMLIYIFNVSIRHTASFLQEALKLSLQKKSYDKEREGRFNAGYDSQVA